MKIIADFSIPYIQYLGPESDIVTPFPGHIDDQMLARLYKQMTLTRALDNKAINLQRTGQMGTYPASTGQEAVSVGIGFTMEKADIFCPYYRDQGVFIQRGVKLSEILSYWGGDERGSHFTHNAHDYPICVPIANQTLIATGAAFALQYDNKPQAVVTTIGEGGSSKGDFYEALNVAGAWQLPIVFVVINNQWAISVPREQQTSCQTIAQKAIAGGFDGIQIDGNDMVAVVDTMQKALQKARQGGGPTLIEAVTYRLSDHTTADDASRYRDRGELQAAWDVEPLRRLARYLESQGAWSSEQEQVLRDECATVIDKAVDSYRNQAPQAATDMIDYLFESLPTPLQEQRDLIEESA